MSIDGGSPSGFAPGRLNHGVTNPPVFSDAADALLSKQNLPQKASGEGILLLADGGRFEGTLFGAEGFGEGELVWLKYLSVSFAHGLTSDQTTHSAAH